MERLFNGLTPIKTIKTMTKIETFLPVFPGFYNTIFEANVEDELYSQNSDRDTSLPKLEWDDLEFEYDDYEQEVVEQCCAFMQGNLAEFVTEIRFQSITSPKEYNFKNDCGNIEVDLSEENIKAIRDYIYLHLEKYEKYLNSTYTSYDGFMSWYDNDFDSWKGYTDDFSDYSQKFHYLGSILEFICRMEDITEDRMYYSLEVYTSEYCEIRTSQIKCEECGKWYEIKSSPEYEEYEKTVEKQTAIWKELQGVAPIKVKSFKEVYPDFSYKCNDCVELKNMLS